MVSNITEGAPETQCIHSRRCLAQQQLPQVVCLFIVTFQPIQIFNQELSNYQLIQRNLEDDVVGSGNPRGQAGERGETVFIQNQIDPRDLSSTFVL